MIYCCKMMSGTEVPIHGDEELMKLITAANAGAKFVITKYGVINLASIDSITKYQEKMEDVSESLRVSGTGRQRDAWEKMELEILGPSPFAKLLADKMAMLTPSQRTQAQEESARELRSGK